ncbi:Glutamate receptor 3.4 [Morella rubra]|uniref:Glutamate receptor 3.4 n=1 Tax=Morella rubra TaxID=262757 RepID=A0A6A1W9V0_9ROSI|nr:Glutamate receptor 3.4 [Morella rubra]
MISSSASQVFQKGSPMARDFSAAILKLSENGELKSLQDQWLTHSDQCSTNITSSKPESLGFQSFWALYLISFATSTICLLISLVYLSTSHPQDHDAYEGNETPGDDSFWKKVVRLARHFHINNPGRAPTLADTPSTTEGRANVNECSSEVEIHEPSDTVNHHHRQPA